MLEVHNLHASIGDVEILRGINFTVKKGETHAIMGPNGSGKSTFANVLAGRPEYTITKGDVLLHGKNLLAMEPDIRAREGVFLAMQYPVELPGVRYNQFLKAALDAIREHNGEDPLDIRSFNQLLKEKGDLVEINPDLMRRNVNEGFSGGEKKRSEILQMALLEPQLALLDETDSGLDIDALKTVADGVNRLQDPEKSVILVTHYQRLLNYITPDFVHVLIDGKIAKSGDHQLALELEQKGYDWLRETTQPTSESNGESTP